MIKHYIFRMQVFIKVRVNLVTYHQLFINMKGVFMAWRMYALYTECLLVKYM